MSISILRTRDVPIKNGVVHKKREIINPAFSSFILAKRLYDKTVIKNDGRTPVSYTHLTLPTRQVV